MCGRFTREYTWAEVHAFSQPLMLVTPEADPEPAYNFAPTQTTPVLLKHPDGAEAKELRWGLVPYWAKDMKLAANMINARVETASEKPAFRAAWKARRCLVPASGYYEWRAEGGIKQPYYIHAPDLPVMLFAGLWEQWRNPEGQLVQSFAIITQASAGPLTALHDRAPLFLTPAVLWDWLHGTVEQAAAIALAAPMPELRWYAVSRAVSNARSQGAALIEPLDSN